MAAQLGLDAARMDRCRANTAPAMPLVKSYGEQNICRLGASVGDKGFIRGPLKIRILQIDVREAVSSRRQIDQSAAGADQRSEAVDQDKVSQVVGAELRLEAVCRVAKWRRHDAGIRNQHIERRALRQQRICAGANALQTREVQSDQVETPATGGSGLPHLRSRAFGLAEIPGGTDHLRSMRRQGARGLDT